MPAVCFRIAALVTLLLFLTCFVHIEGPWTAADEDGSHHADQASTSGGEPPDAHGADADCGWTYAAIAAGQATGRSAAVASFVLPPAFATAAWHRFTSAPVASAIRAGPLQPPFLKGVVLRI